jgi:serine protease DegS
MPAPRPLKLLLFLAQAVALGLALAFVVMVFWPEIIPRPIVEIRETPGVLARLSGPVSYAAAVERAAPAVVNINTAKVVAVRHPFFDDPFFRQFFGADNPAIPRKRLETSLGSGVILSEQGHILTNHHVVSGADAVQVSLRDGRSAAARVIGTDPETDLAVLKIDLPRLPVITLGQSDRLRVGDVVLAIGNPFGVGQTVTMGIVSATGRSQLGISTFENFIQTDAAINPGNSGGALVDAHGDLIGINTAIFSKSGGSQGIGFAIPTSLAKGVMEQIIRHGRPLRGWLGFEAQALTAEVRQTLGLGRDVEGVVVTGVIRNGPAHKAGLQPGDVIVAIDGNRIRDGRETLNAISVHRPGDAVKVEVLRDGRTVALSAVTAERPSRPVPSK